MSAEIFFVLIVLVALQLGLFVLNWALSGLLAWRVWVHTDPAERDLPINPLVKLRLMYTPLGHAAFIADAAAHWWRLPRLIRRIRREAKK